MFKKYSKFYLKFKLKKFQTPVPHHHAKTEQRVTQLQQVDFTVNVLVDGRELHAHHVNN